MAPGAERGAALLEAVAALTILSLSAVAVLQRVGANVRAQHVAVEREREAMRAGRLLATYALMTRVELEQRIGEQWIGEYRMQVQRPEPELFRVAVNRSAAPDVELLVTVVYRPRVP